MTTFIQVLSNGKLICECPIGTYLDNSQCKPCHYSCVTCSGPYSNNCLSCESVSLSNRES